MFGNGGEKWLNEVPSIIDKYVLKFNLSNLVICDKLTYNIIIFAESAEYGKVVLKINIPFKELTLREATTLNLLSGKGVCRCYYSNIDDGILLLERLLPGILLSEVQNFDEKTKIFLSVAEKVNVKLDRSYGLSTYREILNRTIKLSEEEAEKFSIVINLINLADKLYSKIEEKNNSNYLLHSDLYSDNILLSDNEWKAIDPHGFIGNRIIDVAIFLQKELEKTDFNIDNINEKIEIIESISIYGKEDICTVLLINYILNICWSIEVNTNHEIVENCIRNAQNIFQYLSRNFTFISKITSDKVYYIEKNNE